jgi:hypothetical protein
LAAAASDVELVDLMSPPPQPARIMVALNAAAPAASTRRVVVVRGTVFLLC